jgi:hypothetical protein
LLEIVRSEPTVIEFPNDPRDKNPYAQIEKLP